MRHAHGIVKRAVSTPSVPCVQCAYILVNIAPRHLLYELVLYRRRPRRLHRADADDATLAILVEPGRGHGVQLAARQLIAAAVGVDMCIIPCSAGNVTTGCADRDAPCSRQSCQRQCAEVSIHEFRNNNKAGEWRSGSRHDKLSLAGRPDLRRSRCKLCVQWVSTAGLSAAQRTPH
jgi:hypothetical protein